MRSKEAAGPTPKWMREFAGREQGSSSECHFLLGKDRRALSSRLSGDLGIPSPSQPSRYRHLALSMAGHKSD
jgi:hypothetical protein